MNIKNSIANWILKSFSTIGREGGKSFFPDFFESYQPFANTIFENIVELLTDLVQDTTLVLKNGSTMLFADFVQLFNNDGQVILNRLFEFGYAVISYNAAGFRLLESDEYTTTSKGRVLITEPKFKDSRVYVLQSDTFRSTGKSDRKKLSGWLTYLDNVMNSSNTTTARLGAMIMACPVTPSGFNTLSTLRKEQVEEIEDDVSKGYGSLKNQKQLHIFKQQMAFTTVNLSGMDQKTIDKVKLAVTVICDKIKVPSNQVAIIDSTNTNSLSNGGEMRQGDILKYKSYERLLNKTFIKMAYDLDLVIDYSIYNKPLMETQAQIATL